ncbi:MAG: NfeD family protein [Clostridia bacterium]|nr:NfeD family protein [Clostridia bacterium]
MWIFWLIAAIVFLAIEFISVTFWTIFFSFAAIITMVTTLFVKDPLIQIVIFAAISAVAIPFGRPILQKCFKINREIKPSAVDAMTGKQAVVVKDISSQEFGLVKVDGESWTAKSSSGETMIEGQTVVVKGVEGVKLIVSPLEGQIELST